MKCGEQREIMSEQLIPLGSLDETDTLGSSLHQAAIHGNKKTLKKVLDKGIHIDFPNDEGQSPLFCASLCGNANVVEYLLSAGADPNEKSNSGLTPVHAASYSGHVKILMKLLSEGGDLRLHDNHGRSVKDWAMLQLIPKRRMKMMEFLDKTRLFAMSSSGQDLLTRKASSKTLHRAHHRQNTVTKIIRERIGRSSIHNRLEKMATDHHSVGFGQVYSNGAEKAGFISAIPLVCENNLKHDPEGETYNNGAFCVMESMWWNYTEVTIKRLHRELDPFQGGVVDILINEIQHIGKLRHPHILTLMGVCQTNNLDGLVVIYERIGSGSLYNCLHQKMERLPSQAIKDIALQMCNAIIFVHLQGLVHCAISSNAISVVAPNTYKLGNFEYMLEISKCELGKKNAVATNTAEDAVYNWMGPEIMMNLPPSFYCDMYSYCAVIWEIFHGEVPWSGHCAEAIKAQYHKGNRLKIEHGKIPDYYKVFLKYGLQLDPNNRKLSFLHVRDLLLASPKDTKEYMNTHLKHLHHNGHGSASSLKTPPSTPSAPLRESIRLQNDDIKDQWNTEYKPRSTDEERKKQKRKYRVVKHKNEYMDPRQGYNENCQHDLFTIERGSFLDEDSYRYTVQMKRANNQQKKLGKQVEFSPLKENYKQTFELVSDSITSNDDENIGDTTQESSSDTQQYAKRRALERKTSSMGKFSFLNLGDHTRTRSTGAKPACHGQTDMVAEEYSTAGKLTTAGSLYALYNDHSPDLPMGQQEHREYQRYAKLPRPNEPSPPKVKADPRWFGGRGSVRDLAKLFQQHIQQHSAYQSVVNGTVNRNHSNEVLPVDEQRSYLFPTPQKVHQLTYDVDGDNSSVNTTSSVNDQLDVKQGEESSTESDQISKWVDHEIRKIKRNLSKEIAAKQSLRNTELSPDLFDHREKKSGELEQVDSLIGSSSTTTQTSQSFSGCHQGAGDKERFAHLDSCYYDDEIYMDEAPVKTNTDYVEKDNIESPVKTSLPMNTVLKETPTKGIKNKEPVNNTKPSGNNKRRLSRIPTSRSKIPSKIKSTDAAYANIVTIKSSLDDSGVHQLTHEMKNLKTGGTKTVFNDTVNAKKVITTFKAPR